MIYTCIYIYIYIYIYVYVYSSSSSSYTYVVSTGKSVDSVAYTRECINIFYITCSL